MAHRCDKSLKVMLPFASAVDRSVPAAEPVALKSFQFHHPGGIGDRDSDQPVAVCILLALFASKFQLTTVSFAPGCHSLPSSLFRSDPSPIADPPHSLPYLPPQLSFWIDKDPCILAITAYFDILVDTFFLVQLLSPHHRLNPAPSTSTYVQRQHNIFFSGNEIRFVPIARCSY